MEPDKELDENFSPFPGYMSNDYPKPYLQCEPWFDDASTSKGFMKNFHHLSQFGVNEASLNPIFGQKTACFDSFDAAWNFNMSTDLDAYECNPFDHQKTGGHGVRMDSFQNWGCYTGHDQKVCASNISEIDRTLQMMIYNHKQDIKPMNLVVPDEVLCTITDKYDKTDLDKTFSVVCSNFPRTRKFQKEGHIIKRQWTREEDR